MSRTLHPPSLTEEERSRGYAAMCHLARKVKGGVEMRSRFWIGRRMKLAAFPEKSLPNRAANTRALRIMMIPKETPYLMALHCSREYARLAEILPGLFRKYA